MKQELLSEYKVLKDKISELETKFECLIKPHKEKLVTLEQEIIELLSVAKVDSIKTKEATFYLRTVSSASVDNLEILYDFIKTNNAFDLLQRRISVDAYRNYLDSGVDVPGIKMNSILKLGVRNK